MSEFLNLDTFAAKLGVTRQTASKKIENGEYPAFVRGKSYKIPACVFHLREIRDYEKENFPEGIPPITFMIGNHKGGSGKTTATINTAASMAYFGYRVLLVDMDNQSNASTINKLHTEHDFDRHNVTEILLNMKEYSQDELKDTLEQTIVNVESEHFTDGRLDLLPNSLEWDMKKEMLFTYPNAENMLNRMLRPIKENYDFIIIDTHPSMDIMWRMSVMASDSILIGLKPEQYSIEGLSGVFKRIYMLNEDYKENKGHDIEVLGAIVTDVKENTNIAQVNLPKISEALNAYCQYNHSIVLEPFISHSIKAAEQQTLRGPIMFDDPSSKMCAEFLELSKNIIFQLYYLRSER